jgi:hypothetical protein
VKRACCGLLLLTACAATWVEAGGSYAPQSRRYAVELPQGWMRYDPAADLLATRDGVGLQRISANVLEFGKPLAGTKKTISKDMLPEEAAEVARDQLASAGASRGLAVVENAPSTVAGRPGFKLSYRFKTHDGLKVKGRVYGVLGEDRLYLLRYEAPERYYFERDAQTFESVRQSFTLKQVPAGQAR